MAIVVTAERHGFKDDAELILKANKYEGAKGKKIKIGGGANTLPFNDGDKVTISDESSIFDFIEWQDDNDKTKYGAYLCFVLHINGSENTYLFPISCLFKQKTGYISDNGNRNYTILHNVGGAKEELAFLNTKTSLTIEDCQKVRDFFKKERVIKVTTFEGSRGFISNLYNIL